VERRYTSAFALFCEQFHLCNRLDNLFRLAQLPTLDHSLFQTEMEKFDRMKADGMRFAEKRCRRLHMGLVSYSPELNRCRQLKNLWRLVIRRRQGYRVRAETIRKLGRKLDVPDPLSFSLSEARQSFKATSSRYDTLRPRHDILRHSFLLDRLQDPTLDDAHHLAIQRLVRMEKSREDFRHIRALKGVNLGSSISQVEIPGPSGPVIVSDRASVERALCQSLQKRFTQAHGSPFLHGQLAVDVDPFGCGPAAKSILEGTYICPPDTDDYTRQFIDALRWPALRPELISTILSPDAFCAHWKRARERTSSSISGLHFGHYKAAAKSTDLAHLHARFTQLVFMTGISLSRYQSGLQIILEKKPGAINIDLLRAILLIEADFNAAMKLLIGHRMICNAIKHKGIPLECFGSRPGHTAIQVSLNRCLVADVSRQQKTSLAVASVDCLKCYNSVAHPPASLACQRLGTPPSVLCTIFSTIQLMKFFLHTAHGDSEDFYGGGTSLLPFQGVCQGNGAGPAIWLAVSIVLLEMVHCHGHSAVFRAPISRLSTSLLGIFMWMIVICSQWTRMVFIPFVMLISCRQISIFGKVALLLLGARYPQQNLLGVFW